MKCMLVMVPNISKKCGRSPDTNICMHVSHLLASLDVIIFLKVILSSWYLMLLTIAKLDDDKNRKWYLESRIHQTEIPQLILGSSTAVASFDNNS